MSELLQHEAGVFSNYLIGHGPTELAVRLYVEANQKLNLSLQPIEKRSSFHGTKAAMDFGLH